MKLKGSSGTISKTLIANWIFGATQAALGMLQLIQGVLTPEQYIIVAMAITGTHTAVGNWIRAHTTGPLT